MTEYLVYFDIEGSIKTNAESEEEAEELVKHKLHDLLTRSRNQIFVEYNIGIDRVEERDL